LSNAKENEELFTKKMKAMRADYAAREAEDLKQ